MRRAAGSEDIRHTSDRTSNLLVLLAPILIFAAQIAHAGGPRWVAGSSYFNSSAKGQPIIWANGQVTYYTDLGNLSAQLTQAQANAMVATAAAVWSNVKTAAVTIQSEGSLAEDVNGSNVTVGTNGITLPADIQPTATSKPVAVVYDADGSVINAIYGTGASSPLACQNNGVLVSVDNLAVTGNAVHALVLVNGLCATNAVQIANLQYQLIRGFGRVLGLDWSQTNEEMFVNDQVTANGLVGWPIMHPIERLCNGGSGQCMPSPTQLQMCIRDSFGAGTRVLDSLGTARDERQALGGVPEGCAYSIAFQYVSVQTQHESADQRRNHGRPSISGWHAPQSDEYPAGRWTHVRPRWFSAKVQCTSDPDHSRNDPRSASLYERSARPDPAAHAIVYLDSDPYRRVNSLEKGNPSLIARCDQEDRERRQGWLRKRFDVGKARRRVPSLPGD